MTKFAKSVSYLSLTRILQFAVPLLVYPYVLSSLGLDNFGRVAFWLGISSFAANVLGLNIETYAARKIRGAIGLELHSALFTPIIIKSAIFILFIPVWFCVAFFFSNDSGELLLIIFSIHPFISVALMPTHYVLGRGDFKKIFISTLIEKGLSSVLLLSLIETRSDYFLVPAVYFTSSAAACIYYLVAIVRVQDIKQLKLFMLRSSISDYLKVSIMLSIGKFTQLHTNAAKVIVGVLAGYSAVAAYDACEKIVNVGKVPLSIISQAMFSRLDKSLRGYAQFFFAEAVLACLIFLLIGSFAEEILRFLMRDLYHSEVLDALSVLSYIIFSLPFLVVFGTNLLVIYGSPDDYGRSLVIANFLSIVVLIAFFLLGWHSLVQLSYWVVFGEAVFAFICMFKVFRNTFF